MKCRSCGEVNPPERVECAACGEPLLDPLTETGVTRPPESESATSITDILSTASEGAVARPTEVIPLQPTGPVEVSSSVGESGVSVGQATGEIALGTLFAGRYEILSILGQGGMGRVYKARDREIDKVIALKTIRLDAPGIPDATQRFKQELLLARKVSHRNVVRIFDLGEADGVKFFTMEFIEGESLKTLIRRRGKVPPDEAVTLATQILTALREAHDLGIVHRDLKPQNIMVTEAGTAHLMDFGIARATDSTGVTATGAVVGSPDYMSPEQVRGEKVGPAADVFAFGVILYEMLTGELPYQADTPVSKVMMRLSHKPRPVREISSDVPRYLESIVRRCLEIDPELRYADAGSILLDLEREHSTGASIRLRVQRAVGARRRLAVAAVLLLVPLGAAGMWLAGRVEVVPSRAADSAVPAGPVHTLAILPFTNATGAEELEWVREGLPEMLVTDLSQSQYVRPVPGERVFRVLNELGAAGQARFDEALLETISSRAPAETVLYGQFIQSDETLRLDMTLRRAGSGVPIPLKAEGRVSEILLLVDQIAGEVKQHLDLTPEQIRGDTARPFTEVATSSVDALRSYHAGLVRLRQGSVPEALPFLREATRADPEFAMAWTRLAEAHLDAGQQREAEAAVAKARELSESAPLPLAQRYQIHAIAATVRDDLETAAESYTELTRLYPDDPDAHYRLAVTLRSLGRPLEAIAAYERVLQLAPGYGAAEIEMAGVLWMAGSPEKAIATLEAALVSGRFSGDPGALGTLHSVLGVAYRDTANLDQALANLKLSLEYRREVGDGRGQAVTLTNLASVYEERGELDEALDAEKGALAIARAMRDQARESFVLNNMGLTLLAAGDLEGALEAFRESMQIEMERGNAADLANRLDQIADVYRRMGRYDDAIIYLQQAGSYLEDVDAGLEVAVNQRQLGLIRKARGQYAEALEAFMAALPAFEEVGQDLGVAMVHESLAGVYARQGRYSDAWSALETALETSSRLSAPARMAEVEAATGRLAASMGMAGEAAARLEAASEFAKRAGARGLQTEIRLGEAALAFLAGDVSAAARSFEQAGRQAESGGFQELALEASVGLARTELARGRTGEAAALAAETRERARRLRLRPLEAEALVVEAEARLAQGQMDAARQAATDAIGLTERFEGRPLLIEARATLAGVLEALGQDAAALEAWAQAAADLVWVRGSLRPEHMAAYMARPAVQAFLDEALPRLERAGRRAEAGNLLEYRDATGRS